MTVSEVDAVECQRPAAKVARLVLGDARVLYDFDDALDRIGHDDAVSVIIVATPAGCAAPDVPSVIGDEMYARIGERCRRLRKPVIAEVHGSCPPAVVRGCDLAVFAQGAATLDDIDLFDAGARRARRLLFSAGFDDDAALDAIGHIVPDPDVESSTLHLASRIAQQPLFVLTLLKEAFTAVDGRGTRIELSSRAMGFDSSSRIRRR